MQDRKVKAQGARKADSAVNTSRKIVEKTIKAGQETVEKAAKAGREIVEKAPKASQEDIKKSAKVEPKPSEKAPEPADATENADKSEDFKIFGKDAADAFFKVGADVAEYHRKVWDDSISDTKALFDCKTFEDVIALQTKVAHRQFENFLNDTAKFSELSLKTVDQVLKPLGA